MSNLKNQLQGIDIDDLQEALKLIKQRNKKKTYKPLTKYHKEWLSEDEIKKILKSNLSAQERIIVSMLYGCALRVSELCNAKTKDIDLMQGYLTIWSSKHSDMPSNVSIPDSVITLLKKHMKNKKPEEYLIVGYFDNQAMDPSTIFRMVNRITKRLGINKKIGTHTFRRSRATHLLNKGLPIERVKELLRHKNIQTTTIYMQLAPERLKQEIKAVDIL